MLETWLYVSSSRSTEGERLRILETIFQQSDERNASLGVTGALLFAGERFAQCLEGPTDAIRSLKASICADERHDGIVTLRDGAVSARCLRRPLSTAINPSRFAEGIIDRALQGAQGQRHASIDGLARMLIEFARGS